MEHSYLPPRLTERCICREFPIRAMMCLMGHITECHYPMDCALAGCSHLDDSDLEADEIGKVRAASRKIFDHFAEPGCGSCQGTGMRQVEITLKELHGIEDDDFEDQDLQLQTPCECVLVQLAEKFEGREARAPNSAEGNEAGDVHGAGKQAERPDLETPTC